jgi:hypothetical protein
MKLKVYAFKVREHGCSLTDSALSALNFIC